MTVREDVHKLIDALPDENLADVRAYVNGLRDRDTDLSPETEAAIKEGLEDIREGRTNSLSAGQEVCEI